MTEAAAPHASSRVPLSGMAKPTSAAHLPENKNPFETVSNWDAAKLAQIEVNVAEPVETTNDFTRSKKAAARYWSAEVRFKFRGYESKVVKMSQCGIPYIGSESYGGDYFYATVNKALVDAVAKAGNDAGLTIQPNDDKLPFTEDTPWKTINKAKGRAGVLDKSGSFHAKDLHGVFVKTEKGVGASIDVIFKLKAHTEGAARTQRTPFKVVMDCSRCYIRSLRHEVEPPALETVVETMLATKADVAPDGLIDELEGLEI